MSSPSQVFTDYLSAFTSGDVETAQSLIADDFAFNGPLMQVEGATPSRPGQSAAVVHQRTGPDLCGPRRW